MLTREPIIPDATADAEPKTAQVMKTLKHWLSDMRHSMDGLNKRALHVTLPGGDGRMAYALTGLMAVMLYVCAMALLAHFVLSHVASGFDSNLRGSVTLEILPDNGARVNADKNEQKTEDARVKQVEERLQKLSGVQHVERLAQTKIAQLLQPWLGNNATINQLPLPILLDVRLDKSNGATVSQNTLQKALEGLPGIVIDDHASMMQDLSVFVTTLEGLALYVALAGLAALALTAYFAAQATFYINRELIEILHLIGAEDSAIAQHTGLYVLRLALMAAIMALAAAFLTLIGLWVSGHGMDLSFLPNFEISFLSWIGLVMQWAVLMGLSIVLCLLTSRLTVLRALRNLL